MKEKPKPCLETKILNTNMLKTQFRNWIEMAYNTVNLCQWVLHETFFFRICQFHLLMLLFSFVYIMQCMYSSVTVKIRSSYRNWTACVCQTALWNIVLNFSWTEGNGKKDSYPGKPHFDPEKMTLYTVLCKESEALHESLNRQKSHFLQQPCFEGELLILQINRFINVLKCSKKGLVYFKFNL